MLPNSPFQASASTGSSSTPQLAGLAAIILCAAPHYCDGHIASMKHEDAAASFTALLGLPLP